MQIKFIAVPYFWHSNSKTIHHKEVKVWLFTPMLLLISKISFIRNHRHKSSETGTPEDILMDFLILNSVYTHD